MEARFSKMRRWLLPAVLILFILEVATLPLVLGLTYSGRSESPDRILTYTTGQLRWDSAANIRADGAAELPLFSREYEKVFSQNEDKILAPGTEGDCIVRLENNCGRTIRYTAVAYETRSTEQLPVEIQMPDGGFADTEAYHLPEDLADVTVIRAVEGMLPAAQRQDFDLCWRWQFEEDAAGDLRDTALGDKSAAGEPDELTVGLYLVVEDEGEAYAPQPPATGDTRFVELYVILVCVSGAALLALLVWRRKENEGGDA